jgi:RNA polymerase sigma-70 factor (ECF subfamily)
MAPADPTVDGIFPPPRFDPGSDQWVQTLSGTGPQQEAALARLHDLLLRIARSELQRRGGQLRITGPELDDLAYQATADALLAIVGKLGQFRGESRFTTWAYKFVIFEVSAKSDGTSGASPLCPGRRGLGTAARPARARPRTGNRAAGSGRRRAPGGR